MNIMNKYSVNIIKQQQELRGGLPLALSGMKNRCPILKSDSDKPFRRSLTTNIARILYIRFQESFWNKWDYKFQDYSYYI